MGVKRRAHAQRAEQVVDPVLDDVVDFGGRLVGDDELRYDATSASRRA